ncbi:MAG: UDP-3-O-(3-hydroxymyristoyl)glucosamine N-acyltransferase [Pirellulaceae bacterium]
MTFTLNELSSLVNGSIRLPESNQTASNQDDSIQIHGAATFRNACAGDITFATNENNWKRSIESRASAIVVSGFEPSDVPVPVIMVNDAEAAFGVITAQFRKAVNRHFQGISARATISPSANIADNVTIYPNAFVGDHVRIRSGTVIMPGVTLLENCEIGSGVTIYPNATLYENTVVGDRCIIHAGVVLGAFGFGYKTENGSHTLSAQLGNVVLGDDVEIGANTTIDRGTFDSTTIGSGTKIDDQVMIGHNCQIGRHNLLCSQVGIAGSCNTGDYVIMAGQVGIGDHIDIGDQVILGAKAGIMHSIESKQHYLGIPATPIREQMLIMASTQKLPEMRKQLARMKKQLDALDANERESTPQRKAA